MESEKSGHDWDHTLRVLRNCRILGKEVGANMPVLELAAYLHDIGRSEELKSRGQTCHAKFGMQKARKILDKLGADKALIEAVAHCIECHRSKDEKIPQTLEAKILFDADKLDALGAVGIVRLFLFANEVGAGIHNREDDLDKTNPYSQEDTAFREFYFNDRFLKDRMMTDPGRRLAKERYDFMVVFFENLFKEVGAHQNFSQMLNEIKGRTEIGN